MNKNSNGKISLKHGYTLVINKDNSVFLKVETEDDVLEFDGIKGNLMDASDFESHYTDEDIEYTASEYKAGALEFLKDWGVDKEAAEAICEDLAPWFAEYAIEEPTADAWLEVLKGRVEELKQKTDASEKAITETIAKFRGWVASADDFDIYYNASCKATEVDDVREAYKAVWARYKEAERELFNYKETMHIR